VQALIASLRDAASATAAADEMIRFFDLGEIDGDCGDDDDRDTMRETILSAANNIERVKSSKLARSK
jgi:hypothetical protein